MHFGRVTNLDQIDLSLPPDSKRTKSFLDLNWSGRKAIYTGCPIWSEKKWIGNFYPEGTKSTETLSRYSERMSTVEVNSTFYHLIDSTRISTWKRQVTKDFKFCPKIFRGISEQLNSPQLNALVLQQAKAFESFEDRYGLGFIQMPETFSPAYASLMVNFLKLWPSTLPLALELRHPGWFTDHSMRDDVVNLLYRSKVSTVITDTAGRRDVLHTSLTQPKVMIRFLGNEFPTTDEMRLTEWADRVLDWAERGLDEIYVFCHQPDNQNIPQTTALFQRLLNERQSSQPTDSQLVHVPTKTDYSH